MKQNSKIKQAFMKAVQSLYTIAPMLLATIGVVGLFQTFISPETLHALFSGSIWSDTFVGTLVGGVSVGQPVISYVIGGELLEEGISLYAITAFILAWVTLGVVQLPLEASIFGARFTLVRNVLTVVFAMLIAFAVGMTISLLA
ncbi:MAG: permease [Helicobacteraceae bacterium]|jgi:uncharacterized membrane protein YraQ (UPF0718 family)|nr:permease [Helicobacteraceae bacterium]